MIQDGQSGGQSAQSCVCESPRSPASESQTDIVANGSVRSPGDGHHLDYHDRDELSSSQVADFLDDEINWHHVHVKKDWPKKKPTPAMEFGSRVHRMIELQDPKAVYCTPPDGMEVFKDDEVENVDKMVEVPKSVLMPDRKTGVLKKAGKKYLDFSRPLKAKGKILVDAGEIQKIKEYADWRSENSGKVVIEADDESPNPYETIWSHLLANSFTRKCIENGQLELQHFWTDPETGLKCRMMSDCVWLGKLIMDWKTTSVNLSDLKRFQSEISNKFYDIRIAFYRRGIKDLTGEELPAAFTPIKSTPGYIIRPMNMSDEWMESADQRLSAALRRIAKFDVGKALDFPAIEIDEPSFAQRQHEFELEEEDAEA